MSTQAWNDDRQKKKSNLFQTRRKKYTFRALLFLLLLLIRVTFDSQRGLIKSRLYNKIFGKTCNLKQVFYLGGGRPRAPASGGDRWHRPDPHCPPEADPRISENALACNQQKHLPPAP